MKLIVGDSWKAISWLKEWRQWLSLISLGSCPTSLTWFGWSPRNPLVSRGEACEAFLCTNYRSNMPRHKQGMQSHQEAAKIMVVGEHDTHVYQISHQAFSLSMAYCRLDTPPSWNQEADLCPPYLSFLFLEIYHISGRETENTVSLTIWYGVSASLPGLTYLSLLKRQNSLTEIPFVGYPQFPF